MPQLVLHHLNNSRSQRVLWLLEELGVKYAIKSYTRTPDQRAPPELQSVHPLGKSPILVDGEGDDALVIAESGAVIEYLIATYGSGRFVPDKGKPYADNLFYLHYGEGTLGSTLSYRYIIGTIWPKMVPESAKATSQSVCDVITANLFEPAIKKNIALIEDQLRKSKSQWFVGGSEPTAADFMMAFPLERIVLRDPSALSDDTILNYLKAVYARPAFQRGLGMGGKYDFQEKMNL